jgi:TonB family protein
LPTNPDVSLPLGVQPAPVQDLARNPGPMPKPPQPSGQTPKLPGGVNSAPQVSANPGLTGTPSLSPPVTGTPPLSHPPLFSSPRQQQLVAQRMAELRKLREEITFNPTGTSDEDAKKNYEAFLNQANQTQRVSQPQAEVSSITGTYPKDACLGKLEGTTVVGVVVGADGSATAPQLIRSAGYPVLNQTAMQEVTSRRFENKTGQPKPHQVSVTFNYNKENCPQMVLRDSPRPPISPEPQNSPRPPISPEPQNSPRPPISPKPPISPEPQNSPKPPISPEPQNLPKPPISPEPQN